MSAAVHRLVAQLLTEQGPRLVSRLARRFRDIEGAEEAVQDACMAALERWPTAGVPDRPAAWVYTVAQRRLLDVARRDDPPELEPEPTPRGDDRLALLFACCHPAIAPRAQVGLALRTLCGFSTEQIARAFLTSPAAMARRLTRASDKIRDAGVPFEVPGPRHRAERLAAVLAALYLLFSEGYAPTDAERPVRPDVCGQAIQLATAVADLMTDEPEVLGALALMQLHHARRDGRVDAQGDLIPLEDQDRAQWHREEVMAGTATLDRAMSHRRPGPYQIQAAIAALHATAPTHADTDWVQITGLYGALLEHTPSPIVELNAAVALSMSAGPEAGLRWLDSLTLRGVLTSYHLLPATRAEMLLRLDRLTEARDAFQQAIALAQSPSDRAHLARRLALIPKDQRRRRQRRYPRRSHLTHREWRRVAHLFPDPPKRGRPRLPDRDVLTAVVWVFAEGVPWRDLPPEQIRWQSAYHRFRTWERDGTLAQVVSLLPRHPFAEAARVHLARGQRPN